MTALICGSVAFDNIMVFPGHFKEHILPDKIHMLNVAFLVPELRREYGGCGGNIAFNLSMLGGKGMLMATVGKDFGPYREWMTSHGVDIRMVSELADEFTAQAYITTDVDDNQITAFHPGAMNFSHQQQVPANAGVEIGIISPDGRDGMIQHAQEFAEAQIPFIFDPGQQLPQFDGAQLLDFIDKASWLTVNDYEAQMVQDKTGLAPAEMADRLDALIVTRGGEGSHVYHDGHRIEIPAASTTQISDPTGCGDAYRAGLLYGISRELDWEVTGRLASLLGAMKIECHGTQNHGFTRDTLMARFEQSFGYIPDLKN